MSRPRPSIPTMATQARWRALASLAAPAWVAVVLASGSAWAAPLDAAGGSAEPPATLALEAPSGAADLDPTVLSGILSDLVEVQALAPARKPASAAVRGDRPDGVGILGTPDLWTTFAPAGVTPRTQADPTPAQVLASPTALLPSSQPAASGAGLQATAATGGSDATPTSSDSLLVTRAAQLPDAQPLLATAAAPPRLSAMRGQGPGGNGPPGDPCSKRPAGCPPGLPEPSTAPLVASGLGLLFALALRRYRKSVRASSER